MSKQKKGLNHINIKDQAKNRYLHEALSTNEVLQNRNATTLRTLIGHSLYSNSCTYLLQQNPENILKIMVFYKRVRRDSKGICEPQTHHPLVDAEGQVSTDTFS